MLEYVAITANLMHEFCMHQHVDLVFHMEDTCHGHHQVRIIVGVPVCRVFEEMLVEELFVDGINGGNFVVRAVVHQRGPIDKWPNRLHADKDKHSPEPPTDGSEVDSRRRRWRGLGKQWNKGRLAVGAAGEPVAVKPGDW
jgi:hypothetical protein